MPTLRSACLLAMLLPQQASFFHSPATTRTVVGTAAPAFSQNQPLPSSPAAAVPEDPAVTALALRLFHEFRAGKVEDSLLTEQMRKALSPAKITAAKAAFDQLGDPTSLKIADVQDLKEVKRYSYTAIFPGASLHLILSLDHEGKVAGYFLTQ